MKKTGGCLESKKGTQTGKAPAPPKKAFGSRTEYAPYAKSNPSTGGKKK
jgi:hypothetical protein